MKRHYTWTKRIPFILACLFMMVTIGLTARWSSISLVWASLLGVNIVTAAAFSYDKLVAGGDLTRVPERVLLTLCLIGGIIGGGASMLFLRHKTSKPRFRNMVIGIAVVQILACIGLFTLSSPFA